MPRVKPRALPPPLPDRPGRWKLLWRRQRRLLRPTAIASIIVTALITSAVGINMIGRGGPMRERLGHATSGMGLDVQRIVVEGRQKTSEAAVLAAIGVTTGDPILSFSAATARAKLEALTWVRSAIVERQLPGTIRVVLTERAPFAVWQNQGKFALIDRAGNVVTDSEIATFADKLPLVVGVGAPQAAAALLDTLAQQPDLVPRVVAAIRVGDRRWNLCMTSGADVLLPEGAEAQALGKLAELQTTKALLDRPLQEIDMRLPDRLRLRPMVDGPCGQRPGQTPAQAVTAQPRKAT